MTAIVASDDPPASIARGAPGCALFLLEAARALGRPDLLAKSASWQRLAYKIIDEADDPFGPPWIEERYGGASGFYSGAAGLSWVDAALHDALGAPEERGAAIRRFEACWHVARDRAANVTLLAGPAGILEAASAGGRRWRVTAAERECLARIASEASDVTVQALHRVPEPDGVRLLGIAVGQAGPIYALLDAPQREHVEMALEALSSPAENGLAWSSDVPSFLAGEPMGASWCNGVTGLLSLFLRAHDANGEARWLDAANACGEIVAALPFENPTVCCGTAGRALTLRALALRTGDPRWIDSASSLLRHALRFADDVAPGLMVGRAGLAWAALAFADADVSELLGFDPTTNSGSQDGDPEP